MSDRSYRWKGEEVKILKIPLCLFPYSSSSPYYPYKFMSLAIYRKYRPQKWADLTNQNHVKVTLQNEIASGKVAHAYLFTGPRGIGKTTTARLLAKSLNCVNRKEGQSEPCNKCDSCLELVGGNDLDILEIDAASHTGVDNVRENVIESARFTPAKRKYKVFIIDEVHMLSISAFNALLKILEEPPAHAIFILATTEIHKVPATIISRCQRFDFKKINSEELIKRLNWLCQQEGIKVDKKVLADIARVSEGSLRDAESLLGQVLSLGEKEIDQETASLIIPNSNYQRVAELVDYLVYKNIEASISLINKLVEEGIDLIQFTDELIEFLRKMLLNKISSGLKEFSLDLDQEMEKNIISLSANFELNDLIKLINLFSAKKFEIKSAVIPQLPLEIAVIEYCGEHDKGSGSGDNSPGSGKSKIKLAKEKTNENNKSGDSNTTLKNVNLDQTKPLQISLSEIKDKWHGFLVKLQDSNASLVFILKVAEPLELAGRVLKIGFKYEFHRQRVNQAKVKESLENVMAEFFGDKIVIEPILLDKEYESDFIKEQTQSDEVVLVDELPASLASRSGQGGPAEAEGQKELIDQLVKTFNGKIVD